jgi:hypothetical protein
MTTDEFLVELEKVRNQFEWGLIPDTGAGADRRARPRLHVRGVPRGTSRAPLDPIGAVCYALTRTVFKPEAWPDAGEALGMAPQAAAALMAASNDRTWAGPEGERKQVPFLSSVRARLIETLRLEPPVE